MPQDLINGVSPGPFLGTRYLLRDRDTSYGLYFRNRFWAMEIREPLAPRRCPRQLVHFVPIIFNKTYLRRVLSCCFRYYPRTERISH